MKKSKIKEEFPELSDLMFKNKSAIKRASKQKYFKSKWQVKYRTKN